MSITAIVSWLHVTEINITASQQSNDNPIAITDRHQQEQQRQQQQQFGK